MEVYTAFHPFDFNKLSTFRELGSIKSTISLLQIEDPECVREYSRLTNAYVTNRKQVSGSCRYLTSYELQYLFVSKSRVLEKSVTSFEIDEHICKYCSDPVLNSQLFYLFYNKREGRPQRKF